MVGSTSVAALVTSLSEDLSKEAIDNAEPNPERCMDILQSLDTKKSSIDIAVLEKSSVGKAITKSIRSFKRHKRTAGDDAEKWKEAIEFGDRLLADLKAAAAAESVEAAKKKKAAVSTESQKPGLPKSASAYRTRLETQKKDMYKNPPAMPPLAITVDERTQPIPKRNEQTGELKFQAGADAETRKLLKDFHPNRTPEEILRAGSFGGTYFRPIVSAVTNVRYNASDVLKDTVDPSWIEGLPKSRLTSSTYRNDVNKYKVKCGGSLGMWESSGWIADSDPYGWFQWYCRFYQGRRCSDDARQISRWLKSAGPKGRFRSQICNKILAAKTTPDDVRISPVIRQTLLHWGLEITSDVLEKHRKRVGA